MESFGNAVALLVVSPVAIVTNVVAIVAIVHYRSFFHGTDVVILSLLINFILKAFFLAPIPALLFLVDSWQWSFFLCGFYVWAGLCFRVCELLCLLCMSVHWMSLLRIESGKQIYTSTRVVRVVVIVSWFLAAVFGSLPILGARASDYFLRGVCYFLPFDLDLGYALFLAILSVFSVTMSLICTADTVLLLKQMKKVAVVKYQAGRFYVPNSESAEVAKTSSPGSVHARYNELNFSVDLCKLVVFFIVATAVINHLPFTLLQFYQLVWRGADRAVLQEVVQWLRLGEALVLPHALWLLSKRYRHALAYVWRLHVLRDDSVKEEDPLACTLQSYTRKIRAADGKTVRITARFLGERTIITSDRQLVANGHVPRQNHQSPTGPPVAGPSRVNPGTSRENDGGGRVNGRTTEVVTTDLDDGMAVITNRGGLVPVPQRHKGGDVKGSGRNHRDVRTKDDVNSSGKREAKKVKDDVRPKNDIHMREYTSSSQTKSDVKGGDDVDSEMASDVKTPRSSVSTSQPTSPTKSSLSTPTHDSLNRTSSRCSRSEWKEQMRKKHLPAIFVNEAFEAEEDSKVSSFKQRSAPDADPSMHYYLSSDFHPDCLVDQELEGSGLAAEASYDSGNVDYASVDGVTAFHQDSVDVGDVNAYGHDDIEKILDHPQEHAYPRALGTPAADLEVENAFTFDPDVPEEGHGMQKTLKPSGDQGRVEGKVATVTSVATYTEPSVVVRNKPRLPIKRQNSQEVDSMESDVFQSGEVPDHFSGVSATPQVQALWQQSARMRNEGVSSPSDSVLQTEDEVVPIPMEKDYQMEPSRAASEFTTFKQSDFDQAPVHDPFAPFDAVPVRRDSTLSSCSSRSVTLEPCRGERKPPWLMEDSDDLSDKMGEPLLGDSGDSETLRESMSTLHPRRELHETRSDVSSPSSLFDEEIDRGFEEALAMGYARGPSYGGMGLCFESIEEEPEELAGQGSNPFEKDANKLYPDFRTQAIVSRPPSVCSTEAHSPVPDSPLVNGDVSHDVNGDVGSGSSGSRLPWPEEEDQVRVIDLSFESDFSDMRNGSFLDVPAGKGGETKIEAGRSDYVTPVKRGDVPMKIPVVAVNGIAGVESPQQRKKNSASNGNDRTVYF